MRMPRNAVLLWARIFARADNAVIFVLHRCIVPGHWETFKPLQPPVADENAENKKRDEHGKQHNPEKRHRRI